MDEGWEQHINSQLVLSARSSNYVCAKVLIFYWEDGDKGFQIEGRALGAMFGDKDIFDFVVEEFAIPTSNSLLHLLNFITKSLLDLSSYAEEQRGASLLIIHYGGHGDRNDDRHKGEERRSVWAAKREGGPTLEWFRIQEDIMTSQSHILILLDCCFAAQAGRARQQQPTRIEIIAAAAMGMETPMPGQRSFTMALIREITASWKKDGHVIVSDLHRRLVAREVELWATPFYMKLGQEQKSIRLEPLTKKGPSDNDYEANGLSFQLHIKTRAQLYKSDLDEIARWLGDNTPPTVANVRVERVLGTTKSIHSFIEDVSKGNQPLTKGLNEPAVGDVLGAWDQAIAIMKEILAQQRGPDRQYSDISTAQKLAEKLLSQLDAENCGFVDLLEQKLLSSPVLPEETIDSTAATALGMANQLRLRKIICSPEMPSHPDFLPPGQKTTKDFSIMREYRKYGPYVDPAQLPALTKRVGRLTELLCAPKSSEFRSLRCTRWYHNPIEHEYILDFEIPSIYTTRKEVYNTLQSIIQGARGRYRPSLGERFNMAYLLAKAMRKWHSVGWLHQSISSHNIVFFEFKGGPVDYSSPYLGGFEFARPDSDPSTGHAADDVAFNVYRHPARQGETRNGHRKIHDIYSLGVVLLEIGLWQRAFDIVNSKEKEPLSPQRMARKLQMAATERLPHYAGKSYQAAVEACLSSNFDVDMDDANESQLALSFEKRVIAKLFKGLAIA